MTKILEQLKWESLKQRRKGSRLILFYKGLKGQANIPVDDLKTPLRKTRNHHSDPFQVPYARTDAYRHSFFPETIRDWNHSLHLLYPLLNLLRIASLDSHH